MTTVNGCASELAESTNGSNKEAIPGTTEDQSTSAGNRGALLFSVAAAPAPDKQGEAEQAEPQARAALRLAETAAAPALRASIRGGGAGAASCGAWRSAAAGGFPSSANLVQKHKSGKGTFVLNDAGQQRYHRCQEAARPRETGLAEDENDPPRYNGRCAAAGAPYLP